MAPMLFCGLAGQAACTGTIGDDGPGVESKGHNPSSLKTAPGLRLLTQQQYVLSVEALLGVAVDADRVPRERITEGHGQIAAAQGVTYDEVDAYYDLALAAAEPAVAQLECSDDGCRTSFARTFLRMAFRGVADDELRDEYLALLDDPGAGETPDDRLVTLITAALTSPYFLYRQELGAEAVTSEPSLRRLHPHEVATRLSYLVWGRGPDEALLDAADAGELDESQGRLAALDRLLDDPKASDGLRAMVADWMGLYQGGIASKDPEVLAGTPASLEASVASSFADTVNATLLSGPGSFMALLEVEGYHLDADVASVVGVEPSASQEPTPVPSDERAGLLTHPIVLAAHSKESGVSPFPMGKFVYENLLCNTIGPPIEVPEVETTEVEGETLREQLEAVTEAPACQSCHAKIGPAGFAFLPYDPIGRYTANDGLGRPWETSGEVPIGDEIVSFDDAPGLARILADRPETAACLSRRLFRWSYGRFEGDVDEEHLSALATEAVDSEAAVRALFGAIVGSEDFTYVRIGDQ